MLELKKLSNHGNSETQSDDYVVQTEFGSDMWEYAMRAGFSIVSIHSFEYPSEMAFDATKHGSVK